MSFGQKTQENNDVLRYLRFQVEKIKKTRNLKIHLMS